MNLSDLHKPPTAKPRWLAFSCTHCPLQDEDAVSFLLEKIAEVKPHYVVHLGDNLEAIYGSRWPSEYDWDAETEFVVGNYFLERVRQAAEAANDQSRCVLLAGNHDSNALSLLRVSKQVASMVDWRRHMPEVAEGRWLTPVKYVYDPVYGCVRLGQVTFAHGYNHGASYGIQALTLGIPFGLTVLGHTHRPEPVTRLYKTTSVPLPYWYANAGCLRTLKPEYAKRRYTGSWGHAVAHGTAELWRYRNGFIPSDRLWTAKVDVLRTGEGYSPETYADV